MGIANEYAYHIMEVRPLASLFLFFIGINILKKTWYIANVYAVPCFDKKDCKIFNNIYNAIVLPHFADNIIKNSCFQGRHMKKGGIP